MAYVRFSGSALFNVAKLTTLASTLFVISCGGGSGSTSKSTTPGSDPSAPTISTQPANQSVNAGQTATFTVVAAGTGPLSYQWQLNGTAIAGATAASYTTPVTTTADSGGQFRVVVTNSLGSITSNIATLTVTTGTGGS